MEIPLTIPTSTSASKRFPRVFFETMVDWTTTQLLTRTLVNREIKIPDVPTRATLIGVGRINDRETYQVIIEDSSPQLIQLVFNVERGLLLRRVNVTNTMLGALNVQWDFSDYRDVSGIKLSFIVRTSDVSSYDTVIRRFSEIKIDSSLNENVFDIPPGPSGREM